jgi:hypothetical protein
LQVRANVDRFKHLNKPASPGSLGPREVLELPEPNEDCRYARILFGHGTIPSRHITAPPDTQWHQIDAPPISHSQFDRRTIDRFGDRGRVYLRSERRDEFSDRAPQMRVTSYADIDRILAEKIANLDGP